MLTWPCVSIEWNTPPIHAVEVSALSSGMRWAPVRSRWPCGRSTRSSLARSTTWRCVAVEERAARPSVALDVAPLAAEQRIELGLVEVERVAAAGAVANRFAAARRGRPRVAPRPAADASGSASAASTAARSARRRRGRMIGLRSCPKPAERDRAARRELAGRVLNRGHRVLVLQPRRGQAGAAARSGARRRGVARPCTCSASVA